MHNQLQQAMPSPFNYPNPYESNLFGTMPNLSSMASMFGQQQRTSGISNMGINYGRNFLQDFSNYDLSVLSSMVNSTGNVSSAITTTANNSNALLRSQLNTHLPMGSINYPALTSPGSPLTMSGGGIIPPFRPTEQQHLSGPSANPNYSMSSNYIENFAPPGRRSNELSTNNMIDPLKAPSITTNSAHKLTSAPNLASTSSSISIPTHNQVLPPVSVPSTIANGLSNINKRPADNTIRPNISIKTPKRINESSTHNTSNKKVSTTVSTRGMIPASIISKNPIMNPPVPQKSTSSLSFPSMSVNSSFNQHLASKSSMLTSKNSGLNQSSSKQQGISSMPMNKHISDRSNYHKNMLPAPTITRAPTTNPLRNANSTTSLVSKNSSLMGSNLLKNNIAMPNIPASSGIKKTSSTGAIPNVRSLINQNKNSGILISDIAGSGTNLPAQRKLIPVQNQKKTMPAPNLQNMQKIGSTVIRPGAGSSGLVNRQGSALKTIPYINKQQPQQQSGLKIQSVLSTGQINKNSAMTAKVQEMARSGKVQIVPKSKNTNMPGPAGASTSGMTVSPKPPLEISRLVKNTGLSISEVKKQKVPTSAGLASLKRVMEVNY